MRRLLLLLALLMVLTPSAGAKGNAGQPLAFGLSYSHTADPVDSLTWCGDCVSVDYTTGTPWVVNAHDYWPYDYGYTVAEPGCMWDSDDAYEFTGLGGSLDAGQSATARECSYWTQFSNDYTVTAIYITSPSQSLQITETWTWAGGSRTAVLAQSPPSRYGFGQWLYFDCVAGVRPDGPLVTVPGSNGGEAVPVEYAITVTNTGKKATKTGGYIAGGFGGGGKPAYQLGCRAYRTP